MWTTIACTCTHVTDNSWAVCTFLALPLCEAEQSDNVCIATTTRGGHIGFCEGLLPFHSHLMDRVFAQYIDAIFQHGDQLDKVAK